MLYLIPYKVHYTLVMHTNLVFSVHIAYPLGELNPRFRREKAMSLPLDEKDKVILYIFTSKLKNFKFAIC